MSKPGVAEHGTLAAFIMQADGVVFYDFADPLNPVAVSEVLKYPVESNLALSVPYTVGAIDAQQEIPKEGDETMHWVILVSADGQTGEFFSIDVV